jgi:cytochrome c553
MRLLTLTLVVFAAAFAANANARGDVTRGESISKPCQACHGANGVSATGDFPTIAGQHRDYLAYSLRMYRKAAKGDKTGRTNAIMSGQAAALSDKDINDLAAYYAKQKSDLTLKY